MVIYLHEFVVHTTAIEPCQDALRTEETRGISKAHPVIAIFAVALNRKGCLSVIQRPVCGVEALCGMLTSFPMGQSLRCNRAADHHL
jgi:hypothetical protein